jgi:hypothetical protein
MSYPWGIYDNPIKQIVKKYYLAARSTDPGYNSFHALDRFALKTQGFGENTSAGNANSWVDFAIQNRLWLVEMLHGINNEGYSPIDSDILIEHLNYIKKVENNIWCSTVSNVIKYLDESKNTEISCEFCNDTVYKIRINDFMNDSVYNQPLTVKIKVPDNWDSISISNGIQFQTEYYNKNKFIKFNALPDNQLITIRPGKILVPDNESGIRLVFLSENPFFDKIKLSLEALNQQNIDIILTDMNGRLLIHQKETNVTGVINLVFDTSAFSNGLYILRVIGYGPTVITKKLMKI